MGVVATMDYIVDLLGTARRRRKQQLQTVELKVRMDCEGCVLKVKRTLVRVKGNANVGVTSVEVNLKMQKVTVVGFVDASKVLKRVQRMKKRCELWPYVPYNVVPHPHVVPAYDKRAPPGFVRFAGSQAPAGPLGAVEEKVAALFSDENPHACIVM